MSKTEILGVKIDNLSLQEVLEKIDGFLESKNKYFVVTPNPEFLVAAQKDKSFKEILNYADIAIADGIGLIHAAKFLGQRLQRVTGVDLFGYLCQLAEQKSYPVYLLGSGEGIALKTAGVLKQTFPNLNIVGAEAGGIISAAGIAQDTELIIRINQAKPKILFVGFGQVKQEKWIFKYLDQLSSVQLAIGLGGTFDYVSDNITRAPELVRNLGFEWLYRLIKEPWRWRRIFNAIVIFPLLVLREKIFKKNRNQESRITN